MPQQPQLAHCASPTLQLVFLRNASLTAKASLSRSWLSMHPANSSLAYYDASLSTSSPSMPHGYSPVPTVQASLSSHCFPSSLLTTTCTLRTQASFSSSPLSMSPSLSPLVHRASLSLEFPALGASRLKICYPRLLTAQPHSRAHRSPRLTANLSLAHCASLTRELIALHASQLTHRLLTTQASLASSSLSTPRG
jgi:hypothetical protein